MPLNCSGLLRVCNDGEAPGGQCRPNALGRKAVRLRSANWRSSTAGGDSDAVCDYPAEPLTKHFARSLPAWNPLAHELLSRLQLSTDDQLGMLAAGAFDVSHRDAVCNWVRENEPKWRQWLPALTAVCPLAYGLPWSASASVDCRLAQRIPGRSPARGRRRRVPRARRVERC